MLRHLNYSGLLFLKQLHLNRDGTCSDWDVREQKSDGRHDWPHLSTHRGRPAVVLVPQLLSALTAAPRSHVGESSSGNHTLLSLLP